MNDGIGLAEAMLGRPGIRLLDVVDDDVEVVVTVESTATRAFCMRVGRWPKCKIG